MRGDTLRLDGDDQPWARSSARYRIATEHEGSRLTIAVTCRIEGVPAELFALLDTGAAWSVVGGDLATLIVGQPRSGRRLRRAREPPMRW